MDTGPWFIVSSDRREVWDRTRDLGRMAITLSYWGASKTFWHLGSRKQYYEENIFGSWEEGHIFRKQEAKTRSLVVPQISTADH